MRRALKRNDGYVLPYVLGVFLVLSFAAVSICGLSLDNLRAQEASVQQTQALYEAEGKIERYVADLMICSSETSLSYTDEASAKAEAEKLFWEKAAVLDNTIVKSVTLDNLNSCLTVEAVSEDGSVIIRAKLLVPLSVSAPPVEGTPVQYKGFAKMATGGLEYKSYDISRSTPMEGGAGE